MKIIRSAYPSITKSEISYANDALKNGWGKNMNSYTENFLNIFLDILVKICFKYLALYCRNPFSFDCT